MIHDPTLGIDFPKLQRKDPSPLSETEIKHLLTVVGQFAPRGSLLRDRAILLLFLGTGIRLSGLVNLNREDVDLVQRVIRVRRKGGKQELVELNTTVVQALNRYDETQESGRHAFFLSRLGRRISREAVLRYRMTTFPVVAESFSMSVYAWVDEHKTVDIWMSFAYFVCDTHPR
jgi:integrase/recombinase XerD